MKCPKCGLVQPPAPKCKACGSIVGQPAPSSPPNPAGAKYKANPAWSVWLAIAIGLAICGVVFYHLRDASLVGYRSEIASAAQALEALQSATRVGVTHQEYSKRLIDTRILVDRSIPGQTSRRAVRAAYRRIEEAMETYEFANKIWKLKFDFVKDEYGFYSGRDVPFMPRLLADLSDFPCPAFKQKLEAVPISVSPVRADEARRFGRWYSQEVIDDLAYEARFDALLDSVPVIWGCASDKIATIRAGL